MEQTRHTAVAARTKDEIKQVYFYLCYIRDTKNNYPRLFVRFESQQTQTYNYSTIKTNLR